MSLALSLAHLFLRLPQQGKQWSRIENEIVGASPMTTTEYSYFSILSRPHYPSPAPACFVRRVRERRFV